MTLSDLDRRTLLRATGAAMLLGAGWPAGASQPLFARGGADVSGEEITLTLTKGRLPIDGKPAAAIAINGSVPGPTLRLRQGQHLRLTVINELDEDASLHWHGLLLPFQMDGVPGVSFPGIPPRGRFTYEFPVTQSGTYWYHSHSGFQELMGAYGAIVIEPAAARPAIAEHVLVLSDHAFVHPAHILRNLKQESEYYNRQPQTLQGLLKGQGKPLAERLSWAKMRMDPGDISDVSGAVLRYLVNGHGAGEGWQALFTPGQPVRLRVINASGMSFFNLRIPGLPLEVVAADGQDVRPVSVDELQIGPGETYDLRVTPPDHRAYAFVAESADRSGMARATLAPAPGMKADFPPLRPRPLLTMKDMGMDMPAGHAMKGMKMRDGALAPQVAMGPGVDMISAMPMDRTGDPGVGLDHMGPHHPSWRVLTYHDLVAANPMPDTRAPEREVEVHLTGSMDRYMWSMDGKTMRSAHDPLPFRTGERVRVTLVNDTMMAHPIHLHGHLFDLVTGQGLHAPRKHTVTVQPGGKASFDVTALPGDWAFHCHLFLHMAMGMMRVVQVRPA